jgi:cytoskeletal protein CcmA (bactofilin family)
MTKFANATTLFSLVATASLGSVFASADESSSLRANRKQTRSLEEQLNAKMDFLLTRIDSLENQVTELQEHRNMAEACGFALSADGVCQLETPLELFSDLFVQGNNTFINGDLEVQGSSVLQGSATVFSNDVSITGHTNLNDLNVASTLQVFGESMFGSTLEATEDVRLDRGLTMSGRASFQSLFVEDQLEIRGQTYFEDKVTIQGNKNEFVVEGPVRFQDNLRVDGDTFFAVETIEGDLEIDGELLVTDKATFEDDVEIEKTAKIDELEVKKSCDGCV